MAGTSSTSASSTQRQWYLILRREGFTEQRIKLPIRMVRDGSDLDSVIGPIEVNPDFDIVDDETIVAEDDRANLVTYEFVAVTQAFEASEVE